MKRLLCSLVTLTLLFLTGNSSSAYPLQDNKSLLWRISSKKLKKPSYLFGTMHMLCEEDYIWTPVMQQSVDASESLCFEMDLDDPSLMMEVTTGMMDHSGKSLKDYFTADDYAKLERFLTDSLEMDISMFRQMKPVVLQTMIGSTMMKCPVTVSYENRLMETARKSGKEVLGLEKAAEQLDLFDNLPTDSVVKELMEIISGNNAESDEYTTLINAYKKQDIIALHNIIQSSNHKDVDLAGFIDVRNEKWISRMTEKMEQQSVFFAVGAGHLWGDVGLITLLRKAGYTVEPVK
jgi:uncharacterized protein